MAYWNDTALTWDDTLLTTWDSLTDTISCQTASLNLTSFPEAYPNRIPEDVYDSLGGNAGSIWNATGPNDTWNSNSDVWGTFGFIFVKYGPTYNP